MAFKVIQGHVFWGQWKGDKGLNNILYNNDGLISQGFEDVASESIQNRRFRLGLPHYRLTHPLQGTPRNIHKTLYWQKLESLVRPTYCQFAM